MSLAGPDRRGFVLPLVLLLLLAASGLATVALVVARTEVMMERMDLRYVRERILWEASLSGTVAHELPRRPLGGGYVLIRGGPGPAPALARIVWTLDPDSVAAALPAAAEVGWGTPESRIVEGEGECGGAPGEPLVRTRPAAAAPAPDPPLDPPPRLGPVGAAGLLPRAGAVLGDGDPFPGDGDPFLGDSDPFLGASDPFLGDSDPFPGGGPGVVAAAPGARIPGGEGSGVLLAAGDLVVAGQARWKGLVLVEGTLILEEEALVEGVVLAGERLRLEDGAWLVGCRPLAAAALRTEALAEPFPLPGGRLLGRF